METYLGEDPDSQEALEFLCLAEGADVTHYEVLMQICRDQPINLLGSRKKAMFSFSFIAH